MYTKVNEKEYFDHVEKRIWMYNKPTVVIFIDDSSESKKILKELDEYKSELNENDLPIYVVDIDECPTVAMEFHVDHENGDHVDKVPLCCAFVLQEGQSEREKNPENIIKCIHKFELLLITLGGRNE